MNSDSKLKTPKDIVDVLINGYEGTIPGTLFMTLDDQFFIVSYSNEFIGFNRFWHNNDGENQEYKVRYDRVIDGNSSFIEEYLRQGAQFWTSCAITADLPFSVPKLQYTSNTVPKDIELPVKDAEKENYERVVNARILEVDVGKLILCDGTASRTRDPLL